MPEPSAFHIEFSQRDALLRAQVSGASTVDNTVSYWRQVAREARERGAGAVLLVDLMHGEPLGEADWLHVVTSLGDQGLQALRVAHVKPSGLQQAEFCELFARDAGIRARVFEDEAAAMAWLGDDRGEGGAGRDR